jgi:two-component system cell cycle response regulator
VVDRKVGRWLWSGALFVALASGIFLAWLLVGPGGQAARSGGAAPLVSGLLLLLLMSVSFLSAVFTLLVENKTLRGHLNEARGRTAALHDTLRAAREEARAGESALAAANGRLRTMATTDLLTGLPNRTAVVVALDRELERAHRYSRSCALLLLDLDHFQGFNNAHGRQVGDVALREFAAVVRSSLRGVDTLGRWGDQEFVALLPETEPAEALAAAENLRHAVAAYLFAAGGGTRLTCSVGVAAYAQDGVDRAALVEAAERAVRAAKRLGRNQARAAHEPAVDALGGYGGARDEAALAGTVEALSALVEARDHYAARHAQDVAALTLRLALVSGCVAADARRIAVAARLHDVGKVMVPDAVLQKPAALSDQEWALMRTHPDVGADVVSRAPALRALAPLIRAHHEHWDGGGYPRGLAGEDIPLGARIIAVANAYGAMTTDRPYRQALSPARALAELERRAGTSFDPAVVTALERVLNADPTLTDGTGVA